MIERKGNIPVIREEPGGERHYLDRRAIHCGDCLEVSIAGVWVPCRYEARWAAGAVDGCLFLMVDGPDGAATPFSIRITVDRPPLLRWPDT